MKGSIEPRCKIEGVIRRQDGFVAFLDDNDNPVYILRDTWKIHRLSLLVDLIKNPISVFVRNHWADIQNPTTLWPWSDWREEREYLEVFLLEAVNLAENHLDGSTLYFKFTTGNIVGWARADWLKIEEPHVRRGKGSWIIRRRLS